MISIKNLRLKYPNAEKKIFDNLNLTINNNEKVLLLGPSGSGKSTLLNVLSGIVPNLVDLPMKYDELTIKSDCGVIFQDPDTQFCMPKVYEELAFVLENLQVPRNDMDSRIESALAAVGLDVNKDQYINQLSGGMKQKLAIAETILQETDTLFLDEPTAMLDSESTEDLWKMIKQVWDKKTVIIVEHKVNHVWQHIDRVILFNYDGEIIADETPQVILRDFEKLLSEYGVWHPNAWEYAPSALNNPTQSNNDLGTLYFKDITIKRAKKNLLQIPELAISSGEWITITGQNGAGKTTLLESIMQLIKYSGTFAINNETIRKIKQAAKHMFLVYQNPESQFITNSVYEEIFIQYKNQSKASLNAKQATDAMLEMLQLQAVQNQHPFELSVGQKRRLSVAIALSSSSKFLLLDEPTFGLDSHNTFNLIKLFQARIQSGQTIIMVTHDSELISRYATRKFNVENQFLIEEKSDINV
ncbi:energy-coupling factor ABC transporter ATP-binding protein [Staphylococcus sp. ACRSN]|uniref:ABC transporter ATP-binding protein n=1 Tax=Staphylococcus sp. ACRSN TaxID=2918214 RepID=UPI001EF3057D|nr:ABC transporter ATP-binding protein [Staphylococcus sp. ACRSN]MCG7338805.1 energy-coupling factor ABC transporter ATP-binding protein [Staphylococcus sp. ACRSN]